MTMISPSILSADFARLGEEVKDAEDAGADLLHVDVMDGRFVPNITIGIPVVANLKKIARAPLDVHLMIEEPERYVDDFVKAGSDILSIHAEATRHLHGVLINIKNQGAKAGVAINPHTPLEAVRAVLPIIDQLIIMTVNPGFGGQKFIDLILPKIQEAEDIRRHLNLDFAIEIDGGINDKNTPQVVKRGADILVAGSYVFGNPDRAAAIKALKKAAKAS